MVRCAASSKLPHQRELAQTWHKGNCTGWLIANGRNAEYAVLLGMQDVAMYGRCMLTALFVGSGFGVGFIAVAGAAA